MPVYHVQCDGESDYVEADDFAAAVEAWRRHAAKVRGVDYLATDEPEAIAMVHDGAVIR